MSECPGDNQDQRGWDRVTFRFVVQADRSAVETTIRPLYDQQDQVSGADAVYRAGVAFLQCTFEPATENGRPVAAFRTMTVRVAPSGTMS